jgi:hypothetical protein
VVLLICELRLRSNTSVMPVCCYGQLKDHAHNKGTSHRLFTIHNIMSTLTTRFYHYISLIQKYSKVSSKNHSCLTMHILHPTNKLYLAEVDFVTNSRQYCTHHNHYPKHGIKRTTLTTDDKPNPKTSPRKLTPFA